MPSPSGAEWGSPWEGEFTEIGYWRWFSASYGLRDTCGGGLWGAHQVSVDSEGNLCIAKSFNGRGQNSQPKPGTDAVLLRTFL